MPRSAWLLRLETYDTTRKGSFGCRERDYSVGLDSLSQHCRSNTKGCQVFSFQACYRCGKKRRTKMSVSGMPTVTVPVFLPPPPPPPLNAPTRKNTGDIPPPPRERSPKPVRRSLYEYWVDESCRYGRGTHRPLLLGRKFKEPTRPCKFVLVER